MRLALLITLLATASAQAALITPLGGYWTDGTTDAPFVAVDLLPQEDHRFESLLTIDSGSHVLATVVVKEHTPSDPNERPSVRISTAIDVDFYDGQGLVGGQWAFDLVDDGELEFASPTDAVLTLLDGMPVRPGDPNFIVAAGEHLLSWELSGPVLNFETDSSVVIYVPEPRAGWMLLVGLVVVLQINARQLTSDQPPQRIN